MADMTEKEMEEIRAKARAEAQAYLDAQRPAFAPNPVSNAVMGGMRRLGGAAGNAYTHAAEAMPDVYSLAQVGRPEPPPPQPEIGPPPPPIGPPPPPPGPPAASAPPQATTTGGPGGSPPVIRPSPGMMVPGGMRPAGMTVEAKMGKPVPAEAKELYAQGYDQRLEAAKQQRDALAEHYAKVREFEGARAKASQDAAIEMQALQAKRAAVVDSKMAEMEALNREAIVEPEDVISDKGILARMFGAIFGMVGMMGIGTGNVGMAAMGMGGARLINGLIEDDIQARILSKRSKGDAARREGDLLDLHLRNFGDEEKAIQATKLAYYDSINALLERQKAEHAGKINEADFLKLQAELGDMRADTLAKIRKQEEADVAFGYEEKFQQPRFIGGAGGGLGTVQPGHIITTPDGVSYQMPSEKLMNDAVEKMEMKARLVRINDEIMTLRKETKALRPNSKLDDYAQYKANIARLQELEQIKLKAMESAEKQGVLREGEYPRAQKMTGHATTGLGRIESNVPIYGEAEYASGDAVLTAQTKRWTDDLLAIPKAAGGNRVVRAYQEHPMTGELSPRALYTGQDAQLPAPLPPRSFQPLGKGHSTMPRSAAETMPRAPEVPFRQPTTKKKGK